MALASPAAAAITISDPACEEFQSGNASNYDTVCTFEMEANKLYLIVIQHGQDSVTLNTPTITCHGATWVHMTSDFNGTIGVNERRIRLYRSMIGSTSAAATCDVDFAGQTQLRMGFAVYEFGGVDTSGTNGSGAVTNVKNANGSGTTPTLTFDAFSSTDNRPFFALRVGATGNCTFEAGWDERYDSGNVETNVLCTATRDNTGDTTPSATVTSGGWSVVGAEVIAATAATGRRVIGGGVSPGGMLD